MRAVQRTSELERILALPRRDAKAAEDLTDLLTAHLTRPHQCHPDCAKINGRQVIRLQPLQTVALVEAHDNKGLFFQAPAGTGKTLVSALLPRILDQPKTVLFVPAHLKGKTVREFKILAQHWDILFPTIETYSRLSMAKMLEFLERFQPGMLIDDEGHFVKNRGGPRARRINRFLRDYPETIVVDMTGTGVKRSLRDAGHRLRWTLKERCPVPVHEPDLIEWSCAVDEKVPERSRLEPGALTRFCNEDEVGIEGLRRAIGRRIFDTPGAVRSTDPGVDASLYIEGVDLPLSQVEQEAFRFLRGDGDFKGWVTPDGHPIADAVALWRHARELAVGMFYVWDPRPPVEWLHARAAWCAAVRDILTNNRRELDTEFQVADEIRQALKAGKHHEAQDVYQEWQAIKNAPNAFEPNTVPQWVGTTALDAAAKWLHSKEGGGVVWTEHKAFAQKLAAMAGVPYFGAQGKDAKGRVIEDAKGIPCVASIASNGTGRNLQAWSRGWISSCLPTGTIWEQLLARHHRQGQEADAVEFWIPFSCREQVAGFDQACRDAAFHRDLLAVPARLTLADIAVPELTRKGWAWAEQRKAKKAA